MILDSIWQHHLTFFSLSSTAGTNKPGVEPLYLFSPIKTASLKNKVLENQTLIFIITISNKEKKVE
jgi:hypothetical protein